MKFFEFLRHSNHTEAIQICFFGMKLKNRRKEHRMMMRHVELSTNHELYKQNMQNREELKTLILFSTRMAKAIWEDAWKE